MISNMDHAANRREAAIDLLVVLCAIAVAWALSKWLIYPALSVPDSAPVILRPITGFFVAWWLLRRRGKGWNTLGLRRPDSWWLMVIGGAALYFVNFALSRWAVPLFAQWMPIVPRPFFLGYIHGNAVAFIGWLAIGVVVGGFFEELLFRGFLLNTVAEVCGSGWAGFSIGIFAQAAMFATLHLYAGAFAFVYAGVFALANGVFYLLCRGNVWPLIAVHAVWDSVALWGIYSA